MRRTDRRGQHTATAPITEQARTSSARFISPMLLLRTDSLPDSPQWLYELKLDGYRA
jgi:ATP-dependent DNA ligase